MTVLVTGGAGYIGGHMALALLDAGESVVVLDNLSTGFGWAVPPAAKLVVGDFGDAALVDSTHRRASRRRHRAFRRQDRRAGVGRRSARLLSQQHREGAQSARMRRARRDQAFHLLLDRGGLWRARRQSGVRDGSLAPIKPYGRSKLMVEWMLQDVARRASAALRRRCAISTSPAPIRRAGSASPRRSRPISSRSRCRRRSASAPASTCSARIIRRRTDPACATTSR